MGLHKPTPSRSKDAAHSSGHQDVNNKKGDHPPATGTHPPRALPARRSLPVVLYHKDKPLVEGGAKILMLKFSGKLSFPTGCVPRAQSNRWAAVG